MEAGLGDEYTSRMESFLTRVQQVGELSSRDEADRATRATLGALAESITGGQMDELTPGLPRELRAQVEQASGQARSFSKEAFLDRVTGGTGTVDTGKAETQARAVLRTLYEWAPAGEIDDTVRQLPSDLSDMFR